MAEQGGFNLGGLGDLVGGLIGGKGLDVAALEPMWEGIRPTLQGLDTDAILDTVAGFAEKLDIPLLKNIPDDVIENLKNGVKVPLSQLVKG